MIYLFLLLSLVASSCQAANLHALIASDTKAVGIYKSCYRDLRNVQREAHLIAKHSGLKLKETILVGSDLNPDAIYHQISLLSPKSDDTLLFYFSGHGYRSSNKTSPWPNLFLTATAEGVDFDKILELLQKKGARLVIAFADCCNNTLPAHVIPLQRRGLSSTIKKNYKLLFRKNSGLVAVCSSKAGTPSWCVKDGAIFTNELILQIHLASQEKNPPSWKKIIENTSKEIRELQEPYFVIEQ